MKLEMCIVPVVLLQVDIELVDADDVFTLHTVSTAGGQTYRGADGQCVIQLRLFRNVCTNAIFQRMFYCCIKLNF